MEINRDTDREKNSEADTTIIQKEMKCEINKDIKEINKTTNRSINRELREINREINGGNKIRKHIGQ